MKNKLGFNIQPKRGIVAFSQNYNYGIVYASVKTHEGDIFNEELGKALAFAKCELMIRKMEVERARKVLREIQDKIVECEKFRYTDGITTERLWSRHEGIAADYLNTLVKYKSHQANVFKLLKEGKATGSNYKELLQNAHNQVVLMEHEKAQKSAKKKETV